MKISLTLTDTEIGKVKIECSPSVPTLIQMNRGDSKSHALGMVIIGLAAMMGQKEKKSDSGLVGMDGETL